TSTPSISISLIPLQPTSTPFPYTTLFRSLLQDLETGHSRLPRVAGQIRQPGRHRVTFGDERAAAGPQVVPLDEQVRARDLELRRDRKSTRLNSSHQIISYAVFCLKKTIRV